MGDLMKALTPQSSYAAKNAGLWQRLMGELTDCVVPEDIDAFERRLDAIELEIPPAWREPLAEVVAKRREEIAEDDVAVILRRNFDF